MQLSVSRYRSLLAVQLSFILIDATINTLGETLSYEPVFLLVTYIVQDVCLVFSLIVVFLSFFSTYVFQAGLISVLVRNFAIAIVVMAVYMASTILLHILTLKARWSRPQAFYWNAGLLALYLVQRSLAPFFYYVYKRTALGVADPRLYEDTFWVRQESYNDETGTI